MKHQRKGSGAGSRKARRLSTNQQTREAQQQWSDIGLLDELYSGYQTCPRFCRLSMDEQIALGAGVQRLKDFLLQSKQVE